MFGAQNPIKDRSQYIHRNCSSTGVLSLSWHALSRPGCQHKTAHRPSEVRKQRGLRVMGLKCEFLREGMCSHRPACSGDPQLGWSYGDGHPRLIRSHGYLVQHVGAFLVLHCAG